MVMNKIATLVAIGIFITLLVFGTLVYFISLTINAVVSAEEKVKSKVGSTVIIKKDTLIIIDYSMLKQNYTLSDGREVSFEFIDK
jgi:hypothetical protein